MSIVGMVIIVGLVAIGIGFNAFAIRDALRDQRRWAQHGIPTPSLTRRILIHVLSVILVLVVLADCISTWL